jgi:beta-lactamase class A
MQRDRRRRTRRPSFRASLPLIALGAFAVIAAIGVEHLASAISPGSVDPFTTAAMRTFLRQRRGNITAALYNVNTGDTFLFRPGDREQTASIMKVDILATLLHEAQERNESLSGEELYLAAGMIEQSDNEDATDLWLDAGGDSAITAFDRSIGMTQTTPNANGYWGETLTTARDQIRLLRVIALPNDRLHYNWRDSELYLMTHVVSFEHWGVSSGLPPDVSVALKNGWVPIVGDDWQVNSIGAIDGKGRDYLLAVLTSGNVGENYGIDTIEAISRIVWSSLKPRGSTEATAVTAARP